MGRKLKLASVTWIDAASHHGAYTPEEVPETESMIVHTSGYLLPSSKGTLRLAQDCLPDSKRGMRWREIYLIPRKVVKEVIVHPIEVQDG